VHSIQNCTIKKLIKNYFVQEILFIKLKMKIKNHIELILGKHRHRIQKYGTDYDKQNNRFKKNIKKLICFKKYKNKSWISYHQDIEARKYYLIANDTVTRLNYRTEENYDSYEYYRGNILVQKDIDNASNIYIVINYIPYFAKLALLSRLNYSEINKLNLTIFSRAIIWCLYHLERIYNHDHY